MPLTRPDVLPIPEAARVRDDALACKEVVPAGSATESFARAHTHRPDAIWVSERDDAEAREHGDAGVPAMALVHKPADSSEDILFVDAELARFLQIVRKDVEKQLGV